MDIPGWALRGVCRGLEMAGSFGVAGTLFLAATLLRGALPPAVRRVAWASLAMALVAGTGWFFAQTVDFAGAENWQQTMAALPVVAADTRFGCLLIGRSVALIAALLCFQAGWRRPAALLGLSAVAAEAWLTHGGAMPGVVGDVLLWSMVVHLIAGAAWLGALPALYCALRGWAGPAAELARRFSPVGGACVAALTVTAGIQSWLLIGSIPAFWATPYGRAALAKFLLLVGLIALAALNRFRLTPALPASRAALARSVAVETALGLCVLLAAGALLQFAPPAMAAMAAPQ
jgi:putative copper resistance protein D